MKKLSFKKNLAILSTIASVSGISLFTVPSLNNSLPFEPIYKTAFATESESEALMSRINNLPPVEDLGKTHADEVKALMHMYASLKMSERVSITNYDILKKAFDSLVNKGILTNEDNSILQEQKAEKEKQDAKKTSDNTVSQATEYNFESNGESGRTIVIRYTTDTDGDGKGEVPTRIVLTAPDGKTYPVSNTSLSMSDGDKLKVDLTWTDLYLQLDFSKFASGKWSLKTSQAVTFSSKEFAGKAADVVSEDDKHKAPKEEKEEKSNPFFFILFIVVVILLAFFGIRKYISVMNEPEEPTYSEDDMEDNQFKRVSDQEMYEQMKREYQQQKQELNEANNDLNPTYEQPFERDLNYNPMQPPTRRGPIQYDVDEPQTQEVKQPAPAASNFSMVDDETGLLKAEDKPASLSKTNTDAFDDFT